MTATAIKSPLVQESMARTIFDKRGNIESPSEENLRNAKKIAEHTDRYYVQWNKSKITGEEKGLGIGALVALFEMFVGTMLVVVERSPATITNLLTTISENFQVIIGGSEEDELKKLDQESDEEKKKQLGKELHDKRRVKRQAMALAVATSGGLGLIQWIREISNFGVHDVEDLPMWQKTTLTVKSLISAAMMWIGYFEKGLMAILTKSRNGSGKANEIVLNASSDGRCCIEWVVMAAYLWVRQLKPFKIAIDLGLPIAALKDGLHHLAEDLVHSSSDKVKNILKGIFHFHHDSEEEIEVPFLYFNKFFLGNKKGSGIRNRIFLPLFRLFGCKPFDCQIEKDNLIVSVPNGTHTTSDRENTQDSSKPLISVHEPKKKSNSNDEETA